MIDVLSIRLERKPEDIIALLDGFSSLLREKCGEMYTVAVPGFGQFAPVKELERVEIGDDGRRVLFPPCVVLNFEPSAILKAKIAGKEERDA